MRTKLDPLRLWIALTAVTLLAGTVLLAPAARAISRENLDRGLLGSVKLYTLDASGQPIASCSGTTIDDVGHVLTNWHCVGITNDQGDDPSGQGLGPGDLYHPDGLLIVAPTLDARQVPKPTFLAQVMSGTPELDVAVLRIVDTVTEEGLPSTLPLVVLPLGDSESVQLGDPLHVIGYPGVGGPLVTLTSGQVSGFDDRNGDGEIDSIKTDATIAHGNSGGLGMSDDGLQVGIATWGIEEGAKAIDRLMMINLARPYIEEALSLPNPGRGGTRVPVTVDDPGPSTSGGPFGTVRFGTSISGGRLAGEAQDFKVGTREVFGLFNFSAMKNGLTWGAEWRVDGKTVIDQRSDYVWDLGAEGATYASVNHSNGLPGGSYELLLYVDGRQVQRGSFTVGGGSSSTPTTSTSNGVTLTGMVLDADSGQPIPNALVVLLPPGMTLDDWGAAGGEAPGSAVGVSDRSGNYVTAPPVARGQTYTVVVGASGYETREFANALPITAEDSSLTTIEPVTLRQS